MPERLGALIERLNAAPGRWRPSRLILRNYWLVGRQDFHFVQGRINFRGNNGLGKSTLLVPCITLALDGDKRRRRMDSFGSEVKSVEDYLVGPPKAPPGHPLRHEERTGYVALEFQKGGAEEFVTIGLGLHASRASDRSADAWYFLLTDGRRVGVDFELDDGGEPLDRQALEARLGTGGKVTGILREYQGWVNQLLFHFKKIQDFRNLMDILIKLRTPKLSNDLLPSTTAKHLSDALPALSPETLETVGKSLHEINKYREEVKALRRIADAVGQIHHAQGTLARHLAQAAGVQFLEVNERYTKENTALAAAEERRDANTRDAEEARLQLVQVTKRIEEIGQRLEALESDDSVQDEKELDRLKGQVQEIEQRLASYVQALRKEEDISARLLRSMEDTREKWRDMAAGASGQLRDLRSLLAPFQWEHAPLDLDALGAQIERSTIDEPDSLSGALRGGMVESALSRRAEALRGVLNRTRRLSAEQQRYEAARGQLQEAQERHNLVIEALRAAQADTIHARRGAIQGLERWRSECKVLRVDAPTAQEVVAGIESYESPDADVHTLLWPVERVRDGVQQAIVQTQEHARAEISTAKKKIAAIEGEITALQQHEPVPDPRRGQVEARERLRKAGIPCVPLYAAVDLSGLDPEAEDARFLEAALDEAGLLNALLVDPDRMAEVEFILDENAGDRWIRPSPVGGLTLASVLSAASCPIGDEAVHTALASIGLGEDSPAALRVALDGWWCAGPLQGRATLMERERVRFIGLTNRALERERRIARLREQQETLAGLAERAREQMDACQVGLSALAREMRALQEDLAFPRLRRSVQAESNADRERARSEVARDQCDRQVRIAEGSRHAAEQELSLAVRAAPEAQGLDESGVLDLLDALSGARLQVERMTGILSTLGGLQDRLAELLEQSDVQIDRVKAAERIHQETMIQLAGIKAKRNQLQEKLDAQAEDIQAMRQLREELREQLVKERDTEREYTLKRDRAALDAKPREEEVERCRDRVGVAWETYQDHREALGKRLRAYDTLATERAVFDGEGPAAAARELLARRTGPLRTMAERINADVSESRSALTTIRASEDARTIPQHIELRDDFYFFRVKNAEYSPGRLLAELQDTINEREQTITQKDEELFSNFLLHTVADEIRNLIFEADGEVRRINGFLRSHGLSHSQHLQLTWEPIRSTAKLSASTQALAELMRKAFDAHSAPNQDRFRRLLRVRLEEAEREARTRAEERKGKPGREESFEERLERALDYRGWFEFRIYLHNPQGIETELDDEEFKRNSGGEKSLNMFIPLLAAVRVRYMAARNPDAPRMIGLDEAFAGVDSEKTTGMFDLLREFEFSWVMTSEKLWGMAPGLPGCITYNLFMENNKLLPVPFIWDGLRLHDGLNLSAVPVSSALPAPAQVVSHG